MAEGPTQIKIIAKTLFDFREFVIRNAVKWELGAGSHHHPMWSRVAQTLDAVGMNDGGPGHLDPAEAAALNGSTGELTRTEIQTGAEPPVIVTVDPTVIEGKRADEGDGCAYKSDTCKICKDGELPKPVRVHGI